MRLVAFDAGLLAVGLAILVGLGLVRDRRSAARYAGLGAVLAWAATGVAASLGLIAGVGLSVPKVAAFWALLAGVSVLLARRVPGRPVERVGSEPLLLGQGVAIVGGALLFGSMVALLQRARASGPLPPDVWGFWLPRAKTIFHTGRIDTGPGGYTSFTHPEYPPLAPASDATAFRFMGQDDVLLLPIQHWILFVAFVAALAGLLAGRVRPALLWPALASLTLLPALGRLVGSSLADEPLVELFALAGVCAALWLLERDWRIAVVCAVFLIALPMVKNEGLLLGLTLVAALGLVTAFRPWRTLVPLAAAVVLAAVPWRAWHAAHAVRDDRDYRLGDLFDAEFLWDRADRLAVAVRELPQYAVDPDRWLLAIPLALLLSALLVRRALPLAAFCVGTLLVAFVAYLTIYWIGRPEIDFYLDSSAERVCASLAVFAAALAPLLAAEAYRLRHPPVSCEDRTGRP